MKPTITSSTVASTVFLLLFLLWTPALVTSSFIKIPVQERTKTLKEHLAHVKAEVHGLNVARGLVKGPSPPYSLKVANMSTHFISNISVGSPPQNFTVLLKTGATGIWIPSSTCPTDVYDMCKHHSRYNRSLSKTYVREGQMIGSAGMVGEISKDKVSLGGASVLNQSFAEVFQYSYNGSGIPYDGTLGLGMAQRVFSNDSSLFLSMVEQNVIDKIVYGLYYRKNSTDPNDSGGFIIGGRNDSVYNGNLTYVNSTQWYMWEFRIDRVLLLDTADMPPLCPDGCDAVPNTGSHFISASRKDLDVLHRHLGAVYFADDHTYLFNCSTLGDIQPVYISIGETLFKLPWQSFVDKVAGPTAHELCISSFVAYNDNTTSGAWTFGDAFFTSVYVEFDADRSRLGFGQMRFI